MAAEDEYNKTMQHFPFEVVHIDSSQYGTYRVVDMIYDGRPARMLFGEANSPQSGMARDDNPELLFDYNQRFLEIMMSQPLSRVLVIGGGVMMLPKGAHQLFPGLIIDVVEIDQLMVQLAKDYFDLPVDSRLRIHVADGIDFVKTAQQQYDMIIIDAFYGFTIPRHLVNKKAAKLYKKILSPDGVIAVNLISEYRPNSPSLAHDMTRAFSAKFTHTRFFQSDPDDVRGDEQNMIFTASDAEASFDYLQAADITLPD